MNKKQLELNSKDIPYVEKPKGQSRLRKAPEHFISQDFIADVNKNGLDENRRGFLRKGFLSAVGGAASLAAAPAALEIGRAHV
jgi:sulfane dehydrogenase subunit SoxC